MSGLFDSALILASVAGLAVVLAFFGVNMAMRSEVSLVDRLAGWGAAKPRLSAERSQRGSIAGRFETAVAQQSFAASIQRDLARANLRLTVSEYLLIHAGLMVGGLMFGTLLGGVTAGIGLAVVGFYAPRVFVNAAQRRRTKAFGSQLADTLMLMSNSLRAGYSLLQSMETVAREAAEPTAEEFGRVVREVGLGLTPEQALLNLHRRMASEDLDLMVTAINVQHEVGGNLAKIFDTLSETIRERGRIQGEIKTLTAQQQLAGTVVSILPIGLAGILFLMNPHFFDPFFSSQTVICMPAFAMPILALVMIVAGYAAIRKLIAIEV
ncbi:MAG TPA: type II secretion system F family protein [Chloroflexota bacterium]|jgi:tight adherence protein B|nr:type II secretion system F family protein [Chloroflexota bacterium]